MRSKEKLIKDLRRCRNPDYCGLQCPRFSFAEDCIGKLTTEAADAIKELLSASPPSLWTDEPIKGTEFMTHSQGGRKGFEIHFRTDSVEKYRAVQEECRWQIDHAKPEPPKEVSEDA